MYSRGARKRTSSGPEGIRSTSSLNLRYKGQAAKTKTLRTKAKAAKLSRKGSSKSKLGRATSKLRRALIKSYDLAEQVEEEDGPSMLEVINIKRQSPQRLSSPIKKRLSLNETGRNSSDRPLTLVTQTPKWKIEEKRRKENLDIITTVQKSTFEEMNTETKESFGRLTPNIVSLKMQLNKEFNTSIDEHMRRRSSAESDDSFVELRNQNKPGMEEEEETDFEVSELIKGRNASKLLRTEQDLELVKKALHNGFRKKQEAKARRIQQEKFDEEFFAIKTSKKRARKSAVRRLFNKASKNVKSNVTSLKKRLSKGASNITNRISGERFSSSKVETEDEFDLDDPNVHLTPKNMKKLQMLITKNDVQKIKLELNKKALEKEKQQETPEPEVIKPVKRVKNRNSEVAAQKFKEKMEAKRKMSLADKKLALKMRRQKHSAKVTHSNVAKLEELRQNKLEELEAGLKRNGNRLHTRKVLYKRRDRNGISCKKLLEADDSSSMSDSEVSTDSLVEFDVNLVEEELESVESLIEEEIESIESLIEDDQESIESLIEEGKSIDSLVEENVDDESLTQESEDSIIELPETGSLVDLTKDMQTNMVNQDDLSVDEDSGSVVELISFDDQVTLEVNSLVDFSKRAVIDADSDLSDDDSEDGSLIISNSFQKHKALRSALGDSLIELNAGISKSSRRLDNDGEAKVTVVSKKPQKTTQSRDRRKKHSDQTRRGTIDGAELESISVNRRHPKAIQRLSNKRLNF